jgi:hypothetical protein
MYRDHDNVSFGSKMGYIIQTFVFEILVLRFHGIIVIKNFLLNFFAFFINEGIWIHVSYIKGLLMNNNFLSSIFCRHYIIQNFHTIYCYDM